MLIPDLALVRMHPSARLRARSLPARQRGVALIESLTAMLLVMTGVLGIVGLGMKATSWVSSAQYRTEAAMFAMQIVQTVALGVDRSSPQALSQSLQKYAHQEDGSHCAFSGSQTGEASLADLLAAARGQAKDVHGLPGGTAAMQRVAVDTDEYNKVTVTLCWKAPGDEAVRQLRWHAYVH